MDVQLVLVREGGSTLICEGPEVHLNEEDLLGLDSGITKHVEDSKVCIDVEEI